MKFFLLIFEILSRNVNQSSRSSNLIRFVFKVNSDLFILINILLNKYIESLFTQKIIVISTFFLRLWFLFVLEKRSKDFFLNIYFLKYF